MATTMRLSLGHRYISLAWGLMYAIYVVLIYPYCTEQTKPGIEAYLSVRELRENLAIIISVEACLWITYCFLRLSMREMTAKKRLFMCFIQYLPSPLLLLALFYGQTSLMLSLTGASFAGISYALAIGVFVLVPLFSWIFYRLLPEKELRLEVLFLLSLFVFVLGLITTVEGSIYAPPMDTGYSAYGILVSLGVSLICFILGASMWRIRRAYRYRKSSIKKS